MTELPLISIDQVVHECLDVIDRGAGGIALVTSPEGKLLGVLTDGDIRRGLIRGMPLDTPLAQLLKSEFRCVEQGPAQRSNALQIMRTYSISAVPVVDAEMRPVGLELLREPKPVEKRNELVVLMAGGRGMRLRPLTRDVPKPMLHVRGKPMLQHLLEQYIDQGFCRFVITLNYLGKTVRDFFGDGSNWGVSIAYTEEEQSLGTAGSLSLIDPAPDKTFIVMNADVLSPFDPRRMLEHHRQHEAAATMAVSLQRTDLAYGVVDTDDGVIRGIEEKPSMHHLVNAGLYVLEPSALGLIPQGQAYNMTDLFRDLIETGRTTRAFALYEDWIDIGQHEQYEIANDY